MMGFAVNGREPGSPEKPSVLLTGATSYIGGRLVPVLEAAGVRLRCLARQPAALASRVSPATEVVAGDALVGWAVLGRRARVSGRCALRGQTRGRTAATRARRGGPRL